MENIDIKCPYCNHEFKVDLNKDLGTPFEVKVVQYTRDIGRFDPISEDHWFSPNSWSRIGNDFLPFINWEKIGILRINEPKVNVQYKVQGCPNCKYFFDVYLNYSENYKLETIWKHIFGLNEKKEIKIYNGNSILTWSIESIFKLTKNRFISIVILVASALLLSTIPLLFNSHENLILLSNSFLKFDLIQKIILSICLICLIYMIDNYLIFFKDGEKFKSLFDVSDTNSIIHWRNYTLSRFIGVQNEKKIPGLSQIDIVVGLIGIIFLFGSYLFSKFTLINVLVIINLLFIILILMKTITNLNYVFIKRVIPLIKTLFILLFLLVFFYYLFVKNNSNLDSWDFINSLFGIVFWYLTMFIIGTAIWISLNTTTYILKGISKLPLKLSPFDNFLNAKTLRTMQNFTMSLILMVFVSVVLIISILTFYGNSHISLFNNLYFSNLNWLNYFLLFSIAVIITALGFGSKQNIYFYMVFFYVIAFLFFRDINFIVFNVGVSSNIVLIALFFSTLMVIQFYNSELIINRILSKKKEEAIHEISDQINKFKLYIKELESKKSVKGIDDKSIMTKINYIGSIESLFNISKELRDIRLNLNIQKTIAKILFPLIASLIIENLVKQLFNSFLIFK